MTDKRERECYDIYVSIGEACRPVYHLLINGLRAEAYPLDWQMGYSLDTVIHLFETKFVDFFVEIEENKEWDGENRWINDIKNKIAAIHYFSRNASVEMGQKEFLKKMNKRFTRLDEKLNKAKSAVLICNRTDDLEKLQQFLEKFSTLYPHLIIKLINIRNNENLQENFCDAKQYLISEHLSIEEYSFNDSINSITNEKADWHGNVGMWREVLKKYDVVDDVYNAQFIKNIKNNKDSLIIYGAGERCWDLLNQFDRYNITIKGVAVTDIFNNPKTIRQYEVNVIEKYDKRDVIIISLAGRIEAEKIRDVLVSKGYNNIYLYCKNGVIEKFGDCEQ